MQQIYRLNGYKGRKGSDLGKQTLIKRFIRMSKRVKLLVAASAAVAIALIAGGTYAQVAYAPTPHGQTYVRHQPGVYQGKVPPKSIQPILAHVAQRSSAKPFGMAFGDTLPGLSRSELNTDLKSLAAMGVGWIRIDVSWADVQPKNSTQYDWSDLDRVISTAKYYNIKVLGTLAYTPAWAALPSCADKAGQKCEPASDARFAAFAAVSAKRYEAWGVHSWEIWNEPNVEGFWQPAPNAAAYTKLLKASYQAIKKADRGAQVISGGLAALDDSPKSIAQLTYASQLYAAGAKPYFDALGYHPYSFPALPNYYATWNSWSMMANLPTNIRTIMAANHDSNKKIWITEFGAPTNGSGSIATTTNYNFTVHPDHVNEALQAQMVAQSSEIYKKTPWLGAFYWYTYQDLGTSRSSTENFFGLLRHDGSKKPAYYAMREAIATNH